MCRFAWSESGPPQIEVDNTPPFSGLAGGPPVELTGQYRSQWALDTFGAIWETHDTSPNSRSTPIKWTNLTDPGSVNDGFRPILVRTMSQTNWRSLASADVPAVLAVSYHCPSPSYGLWILPVRRPEPIYTLPCQWRYSAECEPISKYKQRE